MGPDPIWVVSLFKKEVWTQREETCTQGECHVKMKTEINQGDASTSQGMPQTAGKAPEGRRDSHGTGFLIRLSEGTNPHNTFTSSF